MNRGARRVPHGAFRGFALGLLLAVMLPPGVVHSDNSLNDGWRSDTLTGGFIFPNWLSVPMGSFDLWVCDSLTCGAATEVITGVTVVNYGTAVNGTDIKAVYWKLRCGAVVNQYVLTYAGLYVEDTGTFPAWTWGGATPDLSTCGVDLCACAPACCGETFSLDLYMDVGSCPTPLNSVQLGFPVNTLSNTTWGGSISDNQDTFTPWTEMIGPSQTIVWAYKEANVADAAPGDTVTFTVTYGRPGTAPLTGITIMD